MKKLVALAAVFAIVVGAGLMSASAQAKPSFAGKWTLVPDPNAPAPAGRGGRGMGGGLGQEFTAAQDEKTLTVTTSNPQIGEMKSTFNLDGSETKNPLTFNGNTINRVSTAKWDGSKLVVATQTDFNGNTAETTQTWTLDASGNLNVETTNNFNGTPTTTKATYKKS